MWDELCKAESLRDLFVVTVERTSEVTPMLERCQPRAGAVGQGAGSQPFALPFEPLAVLEGQWKEQAWHPRTSQLAPRISCDGEMAQCKVL